MERNVLLTKVINDLPYDHTNNCYRDYFTFTFYEPIDMRDINKYYGSMRRQDVDLIVEGDDYDLLKRMLEFLYNYELSFTLKPHSKNYLYAITFYNGRIEFRDNSTARLSNYSITKYKQFELMRII